MIREITVGQYYQTESVLHSLDPRTKLTGVLVYLVSLFLFNSISVYIIATVFLVSTIALSRVPVSYILKGMRSMVFILLLTVVFNVFLTPGVPVFTFWKLQVTREGLVVAGYTAVRLIYLIIGSSLLTFTTTPNNLTDGLESLLKPLKAFRVPVHEVAMMMSIALRFIPILLDETDKIMKAQQARGADFEHGNILRRAKALVPILVPLFVSAFRRANDLAMAMEARCYRGGDGRSKMKPLKYKGRDIAAFIILIVYFAAVIAAGRFSPL
ncbi:MAG: energy-coupling factor transporter transmembrane protein EcfT [Lachnospiraceae bacterium]|nr:energy-coupling factor transporter transmembrane protein EcfT [Lachnospiraceae bacterium]